MSVLDVERTRSLVDAQWVLDRLGHRELVLLEVDDQPSLYTLGHVPGARLVDRAEDLQDPVLRDVPGSDAMARLWRRLGIHEGCTTVFYGDLNNWLAAYGYWLFKAYGLADVRLLDGGRQGWLDAALPLDDTTPGPVDLGPVPEPAFRSQWRAGRGNVVQAASNGLLLDVRTPQEYLGEWLTEPEFPGEAAHRPGHIPGAVGVPWDSAVDLHGYLEPTEVLRSRYEAAGVRDDVPIVTYCRIGERSAHTWFVLHELLGHPDVRNYDGSWTEWGSMMRMPIELGPQPGAMPEAFSG